MAASTKIPVLHSFGTLLRGTLLRRYKRFLADVRLDKPAGAEVLQAPTSDDVVVAHCPNTGPMTGLLDGEVPCLVSANSDPKRKLGYSLVAVQAASQAHAPEWVGIHSAAANHMVAAAVDAGLLDEALGGGAPLEVLRREAPMPVVRQALAGSTADSVAAEAGASRKRARGGSDTPTASATKRTASKGPKTRLDFLLKRQNGSVLAVEVKSVTLSDHHPASPFAGDRDAPHASLSHRYRPTALFPDTTTVRGQRHLEELLHLQQEFGSPPTDTSPAAAPVAALVLVVQRSDCDAFAPCARADAVYADLFQRARREGVLVVAFKVRTSPDGDVHWAGHVPVHDTYADACKRLRPQADPAT